MTVTRLPDQKLFMQSLSLSSESSRQWPSVELHRTIARSRRLTGPRTDHAQTLANGFWNSISLAARTSSAMPRSRSMVVSKPILRIFS